MMIVGIQVTSSILEEKKNVFIGAWTQSDLGPNRLS